MKTASLTIALATAMAAFTVCAQDGGGRPPREGAGGGGQGERGPGGPGGGGQGAEGRRTPPPIILALDADLNGVIDAGEIAKAAEALKKLDKNGDGKLTPDEFHGPRPGGPGGEGQGGQGQEGEGRRGGQGMQEQGGQGQGGPGGEGRRGGPGGQRGQGQRGGPGGGQGGGDRPQRPPLEQ